MPIIILATNQCPSTATKHREMSMMAGMGCVSTDEVWIILDTELLVQ